eukprot:gene18094-23743_t
MRETITVQVGQCGNQIGNQFWSKLLLEHEHTPDNDEALSAFFRFSSVNNKQQQLTMKARALLIDMECGPLQETMRSPLGSLFDDTQFVMDVYGSGNNFAHGHYIYGPQYRSKFEEGLRKNAEHCDSLQSFIVTHSLSGGTGSGVGTYLLSMLHDLYPNVFRFSACVFPSEDNDVVTAPYNSILATSQLIEHADCVLPIDNSALQAFVKLEADHAAKSKIVNNKSNNNDNKSKDKSKDNDKGFDEMNEVAARMLCHLTSSSRFHGDMNVDMNEICTNLVPYSKLHFLMTALSPNRFTNTTTNPSMQFNISNQNGITSPSHGSRSLIQRGFSDILCKSGQITSSDPATNGSITLASAYLARGNIGPLSDFLTCVTSSRKILKFPSWNQDAFKIGVCSTPTAGQPVSVMGIYNSTSFSSTIVRERSRFNMLYRRKAMLHHYTEFVDANVIGESDKICENVSFMSFQRNSTGLVDWLEELHSQDAN